MIRDFRPADTPAVVRFLMTEFPEEERILGTRPENVFAIVKRVYRLDTRILIGLLRLVGRPVFRFLITDDGSGAVGTTMLSFPRRATYISMVATAPTVRRRGYARAMLERARQIAAQAHRPYVVLDVLEQNAPARALYEGRLGYQLLTTSTLLVLEPIADAPPAPVPLRPYAKKDREPLLALARARMPPQVTDVLPRVRTGLERDAFDERIMQAQQATWVLDGATGPEAAISATVSPGLSAAHLSDPILAPAADPARVSAMFRAAVAWCARSGAVRATARVPAYNVAGREALEREGFRAALSTRTLYRTST